MIVIRVVLVTVGIVVVTRGVVIVRVMFLVATVVVLVVTTRSAHFTVEPDPVNINNNRRDAAGRRWIVIIHGHVPGGRDHTVDYRRNFVSDGKLVLFFAAVAILVFDLNTHGMFPGTHSGRGTSDFFIGFLTSRHHRVGNDYPVAGRIYFTININELSFHGTRTLIGGSFRINAGENRCGG